MFVDMPEVNVLNFLCQCVGPLCYQLRIYVKPSTTNVCNSICTS